MSNGFTKYVSLQAIADELDLDKRTVLSVAKIYNAAVRVGRSWRVDRDRLLAAIEGQAKTSESLPTAPPPSKKPEE